MKLLKREIEALANEIYWKGKDAVNSEILKASKSKKIQSLAKIHSSMFAKLPEYIRGRERWTIQDCANDLAKLSCNISVKSRGEIENEIVLICRECKTINEVREKTNPIKKVKP